MPEAIETLGERFDLTLNIDSMTEMDRAYAERYWRVLPRIARRFVSVNHEANAFRARDLASAKPPRFPAWMRRGYVHEEWRF